MKLFCLCQAQGVKNEKEQLSLSPNAAGLALPERSMTASRIGVEQFIVDSDHGREFLPKTPQGKMFHIRQHYPNVDVFECRECGAKIARQ